MIEKTYYPEITQTEYKDRIEFHTIIRKKKGKLWRDIIMNYAYSLTNGLTKDMAINFFHRECYKHLVLIILPKITEDRGIFGEPMYPKSDIQISEFERLKSKISELVK